MIFCAGSQTRWSYFKKTQHEVKQLIPINGRPLLTKTMNQFPGATIIISDNEYKDKFIKLCRSYMVLEKTDSLIESIMLTNRQWTDFNIILLGDVLFSSHTVKQIKEYDGDLMFFGTKSEIFAVVFKDKEKFYKYCQDCRNEGGKKLWHLYRFIHNIKEHQITDNFTFTKDTTDFDCVLQYIKYLECLKSQK